uniref:Uncharacterized protein n=1 Tax=Anguilla anguilla TaxID=7936 RepID=A0A0E9T434_ANGAN
MGLCDERNVGYNVVPFPFYRSVFRKEDRVLIRLGVKLHPRHLSCQIHQTAWYRVL